MSYDSTITWILNRWKNKYRSVAENNSENIFLLEWFSSLLQRNNDINKTMFCVCHVLVFMPNFVWEKPGNESKVCSCCVIHWPFVYTNVLHFEFHIGTKNIKFVEDHPMNIHVQFVVSEKKAFNAWNQTAQEWSLEGPLQSVCFICQSEIQDGHHHNT
jgi:hypothetical protein